MQVFNSDPPPPSSRDDQTVTSSLQIYFWRPASWPTLTSGLHVTSCMQLRCPPPMNASFIWFYLDLNFLFLSLVRSRTFLLSATLTAKVWTPSCSILWEWRGRRNKACSMWPTRTTTRWGVACHKAVGHSSGGAPLFHLQGFIGKRCVCFFFYVILDLYLEIMLNYQEKRFLTVKCLFNFTEMGNVSFHFESQPFVTSQGVLMLLPNYWPTPSLLFAPLT